MNILLLRTIVCVAEEGSFSRAAEYMNCVQSNVTNRIKRLEDHFGQIIFERGKGGARLTTFGEFLNERAKHLLSEFDSVENELLDSANSSAPLKLGSMETTAAARLPKVLKELQKACPKSKISLNTGTTAELLRLLLNHKFDACFVAGPVDDTRFKSTLAFQEKLMLVSATKSAPTGSLFVFSRGCSYRSLAETWLRSEGRMDAEIIEMGSFDGILGCLEAGMGFSILPESALQPHLESRGLFSSPLPDIYCDVETRLATRIDYKDSKSFLELQNILKSFCKRRTNHTLTCPIPIL